MNIILIVLAIGSLAGAAFSRTEYMMARDNNLRQFAAHNSELVKYVPAKNWFIKSKLALTKENP